MIVPPAVNNKQTFTLTLSPDFLQAAGWEGIDYSSVVSGKAASSQVRHIPWCLSWSCAGTVATGTDGATQRAFHGPLTPVPYRWPHTSQVSRCPPAPVAGLCRLHLR